MQWLSPTTRNEAEEFQRQMAEQVVIEDAFSHLNYIAGMDVSNNLYDPEQMVYASVVVLTYPQLQKIDEASIAEKQSFPYIPGLLGFREAPSLIKAFEKLQHKPDLIFVDGHGISHPRGLGIASHIGVLLGIPTVGVAKSILVGHPAKQLDSEVGSQASLVWKGKILGTMLRTKQRSNPLIISTGHRVSQTTAVALVQNCLRGYRLPEPTRQAHLAANQMRRSQLESQTID